MLKIKKIKTGRRLSDRSKEYKSTTHRPLISQSFARFHEPLKLLVSASTSTDHQVVCFHRPIKLSLISWSAASADGPLLTFALYPSPVCTATTRVHAMSLSQVTTELEKHTALRFLFFSWPFIDEWAIGVTIVPAPWPSTPDSPILTPRINVVGLFTVCNTAAINTFTFFCTNLSISN